MSDYKSPISTNIGSTKLSEVSVDTEIPLLSSPTHNSSLSVVEQLVKVTSDLLRRQNYFFRSNGKIYWDGTRIHLNDSSVENDMIFEILQTDNLSQPKISITIKANVVASDATSFKSIDMADGDLIYLELDPTVVASAGTTLIIENAIDGGSTILGKTLRKTTLDAGMPQIVSPVDGTTSTTYYIPVAFRKGTNIMWVPHGITWPAGTTSPLGAIIVDGFQAYPEKFVDSELKFSAALTDLTALGGGVILLTGSFGITSPYTIPTNVKVLGRGKKTVLTITNGAQLMMSENSELQDFKITVPSDFVGNAIHMLGGKRAKVRNVIIDLSAAIDQTTLVTTTINANASITNKFPVGSNINTMLTLSDGSVLVGGNFPSYNSIPSLNGLVKIKKDGTADTAFNANVAGKLNGTVYSLVILSDGSILVGGSFTNYGGIAGRNYLVKLDSTGVISDTTFDTNLNGLLNAIPSVFGAVRAIDVDSSNNVYIGGTFKTMGSSVDSAAAKYSGPTRGVSDISGNLYVTDSPVAGTNTGNAIRKIDLKGNTTTIAGNQNAGHVDAVGAAAFFNNPTGIARDGSGNLYVADTGNNVIRKVLPDGTTTTFAGTGFAQDIFEQTNILEEVRATSGQSIVISADGKFLYRVFTNATVGFEITTWQIHPITGAVNKIGSYNSTVNFGVIGIEPVIAPDGNSLYATSGNFLYQFTRNPTTGAITLCSAGAINAGFALSGSKILISPDSKYLYLNSSVAIYQYSINKTVGANYGALTALSPASVSLTASTSSVYLLGPSDLSFIYANHASATSSYLSSFSRNATTGLLTALVGSPLTLPLGTWGVILSPDESYMYMKNPTTKLIYQYSRNVSTGLLAALTPASVATGNGGGERIYIAPDGKFLYTINSTDGVFGIYTRTVSTGLLSATYTTTAISLPAGGVVPSNMNCASPNGSAIYITASFAGGNATFYFTRNSTTGSLTQGASRVDYVSDIPILLSSFFYGTNRLAIPTYTALYHRLRFLNRNLTTGELTANTLTDINAPKGITIDGLGNLYVTDTGNNKIKKIDPSGTVSVVAGSGVAGATDHATNPLLATFKTPTGITIDILSNYLYVADSGNYKIRKIIGGGSSGSVSTFSGTGVQGFADGIYSAATFYSLSDIAFDSSTNNLFVPDSHSIRMINSAGTVSTIAGTNTSGYVNSGNSSLARFNAPQGFCVRIYPFVSYFVMDTSNYAIREYGFGVISYSGIGTANAMVDGRTFDSLIKLNSAGVLNSTFSVNANPNNTIDSIADTKILTVKTTPDNQVLVGGTFSSYNGNASVNRLIKCNASGTPDNTFINSACDFNNSVWSVTVQPYLSEPSGYKLLIGGAFTNYGGITGRNRLVRVSTSGILDTVFCANSTDGAKFNNDIYSIAIKTIDAETSANKILVAGSFNGYGGVPGRSFLLRLDAEGILDTNFCVNGVDGKISGSVSAVAVQPNVLQADGETYGNIFFGGNFVNYASTSGLSRFAVILPMGLTVRPPVNVTGIRVEANNCRIYESWFVGVAAALQRTGINYVSGYVDNADVDSLFE